MPTLVQTEAQSDTGHCSRSDGCGEVPGKQGQEARTPVKRPGGPLHLQDHPRS